MALFCVFGVSSRNLPFDAKCSSNRFFERLCLFVDYEVRALGDKHRAAMLVIDDGVPFADVLCRKLTTLHPLKVERRRLPAALVGLRDLVPLRFCVVAHQVCPPILPRSAASNRKHRRTTSRRIPHRRGK